MWPGWMQEETQGSNFRAERQIQHEQEDFVQIFVNKM